MSPFLFLFLGYDYVNTGQEIFSTNFLGFICIFLSFLGLTVYLFKEMYTFKKNIYNQRKYGAILYNKSQYGILRSKYVFASSSNNRNKRKYFLNIEFSNSTFIGKVICNKETYEKISKGDRVLVISFDNKKAYGVISNQEI